MSGYEYLILSLAILDTSYAPYTDLKEVYPIKLVGNGFSETLKASVVR